MHRNHKMPLRQLIQQRQHFAQMFAHAESVVQNQLKDNELTLFVRLGTDFVDNYYEYELPLKVTEWNSTNPDLIWPEGNNIEIEFDRLLDLKMERNTKLEQGVPGVSSVVEYEKADPNNANNRIKVKGSPNLQGVKTIMIGVRNPSKSDPDNTWTTDNGDAECVNVWVNEMRLTDFVSDGGSAAVGQMQLQLADFAVVQAAGNYSGINWGAVDSLRARSPAKSKDGGRYQYHHATWSIFRKTGTHLIAILLRLFNWRHQSRIRSFQSRY